MGVGEQRFGVWACGRIGVFAVAFLDRAGQKPPVSRRNGEWANGRNGEWASGCICVPEGLNDRSQAIYCLELRRKRIRPVGTV
jgi:hypothetical protein